MQHIKKGVLLQMNKKKYAILILALLLHIILLILLFARITLLLFPHSQTNGQDFDQEAQELKKDWAARKNEAPVVFFDEPDEPKNETTAEPVVHDDHEITQMNNEDETPQEQESPVQETHEIITQMAKQDASKVAQQEKQFLAPEPREVEQALPPKQEEKKVQKLQEPVTKKIAPQKQPIKQTTKNDKKPGLKLADLTYMYMEKMDNIPNGQLFMQGDTSKLPPDHQIIFERYRTKVNLIIDRIRSAHPCPVHIPAGLSVQLHLALNNAGKFKDIHITQSSQFPGIDDYLLFIYQEASKEFPPIPACLDEKLFKGYVRLNSYQPRPGEKIQGNWFGFR